MALKFQLSLAELVICWLLKNKYCKRINICEIEQNNWVAPFVTDPLHTNSTPLKNPPFYHHKTFYQGNLWANGSI